MTSVAEHTEALPVTVDSLTSTVSAWLVASPPWPLELLAMFTLRAEILPAGDAVRFLLYADGVTFVGNFNVRYTVGS